MRLIRTLIVVVAVLAAIVFSVINLDAVTIRFDPFGLVSADAGSVQTPLAFVIIAAAAFGFFIGMLLEYDRNKTKRAEARRARREGVRLQRDNDRMHKAMKSVDHPESATPALPRN